MSNKLLANGYIDATFCATGDIGMSQIVQVMIRAYFAENLAYIRGGEIKDFGRVFAFVFRAFFLFNLFALFIKDCFDLVRQEYISVAISGFCSSYKDKPFVLVYVVPFKVYRFRSSYARKEVEKDKPLNAPTVKGLYKSVLLAY